jgi:hypothetical protein
MTPREKVIVLINREKEEWLFCEELGKEETEFILTDIKGELIQYSSVRLSLEEYLQIHNAIK